MDLKFQESLRSSITTPVVFFIQTSTLDVCYAIVRACELGCLCVCMRACVRAWMPVCMRACVRACELGCLCVCVRASTNLYKRDVTCS